MVHRVVKLAQEVLENKDNYSNVVITKAENIVSWSNARREKVRKLWTNYREEYKAITGSRNSIRRNDLAKFANKVLAGWNAEARNDFYMCKSVIIHRKEMFFALLMFEYAVRASTYKDVALMHRYLVCVNSKILDASLTEVSFLRYVDHNVLAEILLFRLSRKGN
jgi:hypothetical protein